MTRHRISALVCAILCGALMTACAHSAEAASRRALSVSGERQAEVATASLPGQSRTLLPDGRWLYLGGAGPNGSVTDATIVDVDAGAVTPLNRDRGFARAWHTATMLPTGKVLIVGGLSEDGVLVTTSELFDPLTLTFAVFEPADGAPSARAFHTATVLIDGTVLFAGGLDASGTVLGTIERWDSRALVSEEIALPFARYGQTATLVADGDVVLSGGFDASGQAIEFDQAYDPHSGEFTVFDGPLSFVQPPWLDESVPTNDAVDVAPDALIGLRFSGALPWPSSSRPGITLEGQGHVVDAQIVPAEAGMEAFVIPASPLRTGRDYVIKIPNLSADGGPSVNVTEVRFSTALRATGASEAPKDSVGVPLEDAEQALAGEDWEPTGDGRGGWRTGRKPSQWQSLPPLRAAKGVTALAGQVLRLNGEPITGATLEIAGAKARTDATGRFLLTGVRPGHAVLEIDGGNTHGFYEAGVDIVAGITTVLPYTIWLTKIDWAHGVTIASPTTAETIIATPEIPGLELHLPAGTIIRDHGGKVVTRLSITAVPIDRPPFPLPNLPVPLYFTVQPGGAYVATPTGAPAQLIYPNRLGYGVGTRFDFWNYDADDRGWYTYGQGAVELGGARIIPDPGVGIYEFTGAMVIGPHGGSGAGPCSGGCCDGPDGAGDAPGGGPGDGPSCGGGGGGGAFGGEPVHLYTGLYVQRTVDLYLPDVIPIVLRRTYRQNDGLARPFGVSTTHPYEIYLEGAAGSDLYAYIELVLPDGAHVHYDHVPGADPWLYEHTGTPSRYYKSRLKWTSATVGWTLTFTDGTVYSFPDAGFQTRTAKGALTGIRDRFGNRLTVDRDATTGNVQKITSPHGRWVAFTYDASGGRPDSIKTATDNGGRVVTYTYDAQNRLIQVDDVGGGKTTYAYSGLTDRMTTVTNAREWDNDCGTPCAVPPVPFLTNEFLSDGKVKKQTLADGNYFQFTYTIDGSGNAQTDLEDRRHNIRRVTFNSEGYELTITLGANLPASQQLTTTYTRGTTPPDNRLRNFVTLVTDPLILASTGGPRQTKLDYYSETGKIQRITRLFGTAAPLTTDFTYEPRFAQLASLTDASGHATTIAFDPYDPRALPHRIMDATNRQVQLSFTGDGQLQSMTTPFLTTDPPQGIPTMSFAYASGDLVGITDSAGNAITRFVDNLGRVRSVTNALGQTTTYSYDNVGRVQDITDPLAGATRLRYDKNGNLKSVEDARQSGLNHKTTSLTYDALDRLATRQDPLGRTPEILTYDQEGNLSTYTDRRGKIADYGYDEFNRRKCAGFGRSGGGMDCTVPASYERAIQYTYDNASRLTRGNDSLTGIITLGYDDADHQTSEVSTQASLTYTFDGDRRKTLTIAGQPQRCYDYDNANRLTGLRWGGCGANPAVSIAHDEQGRRGTVTLANGVSQTYGYEPRSYVSSIQYQSGTIVLGGLIYTYNATGNRLTTSGTLARTGLPNAVSANTISHDDANELKQWATATPTLSYDNAGNLVGDGNNVYVWDARNQLVSITGAATVSFQYDAFQRRIARTPQSGIATNFVNDKLNRAESIVGGVVSSQITGLGLDDNFAQFDGTTLTGFSTDALGSTLMVSNGGGAIGAQYTYEPFGLSSNNGASPSTELQFTGRENDNTGLAYYRARYYAPQWGRFITEDPIVLPRLLHQDGTSMIMQRSGSGAADDPVLSLALALSTPSLSLRGLPLGGLYAYADNNPLNLIDPTGLAAAASGPSSAFPHPRIPEKECTVWCGCVFVVCNCFRSDHGCWTQSYRGVVIPGLPVGFRVFTCAAFDAGILGGT